MTMTPWRPTPGMVALLEPHGGDREQVMLTGIVLPDSGRILVDLGASPAIAAVAEDVTASFFAPDALYRLDAVASPTGTGSVVELDVRSVERVQRRSERRSRVRVPVTVAGGARSHLPAETVDLAAGGCRIATDRPLPVGADATLTIRLPGDDEPVTVEAQVLEVIPSGDHWEERVRFVAVRNGSAERLRTLVP